MDLLNDVERLGGNAVQVITLIDEGQGAEGICMKKRAAFHGLLRTSDITRTLEELPKANLTKVKRIVKLLNQA